MERTGISGKTREQGVEFGSLTTKIADHHYPTTSREFIENYGKSEVGLPVGTQTIQDLFEPLEDEQFDTAADVRQAIFNMVDERAIGRKGYSDRTPPVLGERTEWSPESL